MLLTFCSVLALIGPNENSLVILFVAKKTVELVLLFHKNTTKLLSFLLAQYEPKKLQSVKKSVYS